MSKLYPTGIVSQQSTTLNGNYQQSYSFSVSAPFDCEKVVISCSGGNTNNGVAFNIGSSSGYSTGIWLNAGYGTYTYNGKCNSVRLSNVTFPQGYPDIYCRIDVKFYY